MFRKVIVLTTAVLVLSVTGVVSAAPHMVFDGALQNGWQTNGGISVQTVNIGGFDETVLYVSGGAWHWAKMRNSGTVNLVNHGILQFEAYFDSAHTGSTMEWIIVAPEGGEWNGTYKKQGPYSIDGGNWFNGPFNLSKDTWYTVQYDGSSYSWWVSDAGTIKHWNFQLNAGGLLYIRDVRFIEPGGNLAPTVNAGPDQWIMLPNDMVNLDGTVNDDGRPDPPALVTLLWEKISGPGTVIFGDETVEDTTATFSTNGTYVLRLTADDSELSGDDTITIIVYEEGHNEPPMVDAGNNQIIELSDGFVNLDGTATDDGFPIVPGVLTTLWERISGPSSMSFGDAGQVDTTASFTETGTYVLRLTADDGAETASDTVTITVNPDGAIPLYGMFEANLSVTTSATNLQMPYDNSPPSGVTPEIGVSVDVLFSDDNWTTTYTQPAFYFEEFDHQIKGGRDWLYPTGTGVWKVRFTPTTIGTWQYKTRVTDSGGTTETSPQSFPVIASNKKGFLRVSAADSRYFEFQNGEFFSGLGHNLRYGQIDWNESDEIEQQFSYLNTNGMQLFRMWLTHWGIYCSAWGIWHSPLTALHTLYIPHTGMSIDYAYPGSDVSMKLSWTYSPGMMLGHQTGTPAVKQNTTYRIFITYLIPTTLNGPRIVSYPYGFLAKTGGWLGDLVSEPGQGTPVTGYVTAATGGWTTLEGSIATGSSDYLPYLYLALENIDGTGGTAVYIDRVEIREDLGGGQYGPNIVGKPWMAQHMYMDQRKSYMFDKAVELAEQYDIYLRPVILEKNEWILDHIDHGGNMVASGSNDYFYGDWRNMTKNRWLQQAWQRYCQARWGYSTHIHSWELVNEANPGSSRHYAQTDEFAIYMHQFVPNDHLSSTSFWTTQDGTFDNFWTSVSYPNPDFADIHRYSNDPAHLHWDDTAKNTQYYSDRYNNWPGMDMPLMRGETGFHTDIANDTQRIWMHNYIWGMVNPGGMYEQYWDENNEFSAGGTDPRVHFRAFKNFIDPVPLNNGNYVDAAATVIGSSDLRAWGQKDTVWHNAHLWIQNDEHTWKNIVDGNPMPPVSGTVEITGFTANKTYVLQWWDPYQSNPATQITATELVTADGTGKISLAISNLDTDIAVKIVNPVGDIDGDYDVDGADIEIMAAQWLQPPSVPSADIAPGPAGDGIVDHVDFGALAGQWPNDYLN